MVMSMEYFKKIQCYKPGMGIIDAPINIEEVALLQDSVDKNMLGRIKFVNYSKQSIIAIFVRLRAANIAGESISLDKERFIYQDMKISSGELYGNRIPISLPEDTRYFSVQLEKVVFDNGEIWNAANGTSCKISQKEIQVPEEVLDNVKEELQKRFNNVEYIRYFYEENQDFWECTCGRINSSDDEVCPFCNNSNVRQKRYLTQEKISKIIDEKEGQLLQEQERIFRIKRGQEEKKARQEQEERERLEQVRQENLKLEVIRQKKQKICSVIGAISFIVCALYAIIIKLHIFRLYTYDLHNSSHLMWIICWTLISCSYIAMAVLLYLRKKNIIWLIAIVIQIFQKYYYFYRWYFDLDYLFTIYGVIAICVMLSEVMLFVVFLYNTIFLTKRKIFVINRVLSVCSIILLFIGNVLQIYQFCSISFSYFSYDMILYLCEVIAYLCTVLWIRLTNLHFGDEKQAV